MGRKGSGCRGFIKRKGRVTTEEAAEESSTEEAQDAHSWPPTDSYYSPDSGHTSNRAPVGEDMLEGAGSQEVNGPAIYESRGHMQQRQKRELKQLRDQAKRAGRKGKAELKEREEVLAAIHAKEVDLLCDRLNSHVVGVSEQHSVQMANRMTKAQRRRARLLQRSLEHDEQLAEELATVGTSKRESELCSLEELLLQHGLKVFEIPADGNCMYRALAHQCQLQHVASISECCKPAMMHLALRRAAAKYIAEHPAIFLPFIVDADSDDPPHNQLQQFCSGVEGHEWGSHVELHALSEVLGANIQVFSAAYPLVEMNHSLTTADSPTLQVCYLKHAFAAGEHYHSVVSLGSKGEKDTWLETCARSGI